MSRVSMYVGASAALAGTVLLRAHYERPTFYSAAVYISQSNGSLMLLINLALIVVVSFGYGLQRLLYGPLRPIETEQLYDKAWFAVSETLLAMTIFRDDIGVWFFAMFLCLLGGKVWQWIGEGRVEFLEQQPPANPRLFHARLSASLLLSVAFDVCMMQYCIDTILQQARPGMMVMFGFEYALLAIASISSLLRYVLSLCETLVVYRQTQAREQTRRVEREQRQQRRESGNDADAVAADEDEEEDDDDDVPGWEEKGRWVFYLDLATDFVKSVVYCGFFIILIAFHGIPIHIMRDLFITLRSLFKRINDFIAYRNATQNMNARYPDATVEELDRENTCIVCREEMRPWNPPGVDGAQAGRRVDERQRPKKLPCGHILHFGCLRSWLERQQVCPTCRRPVLAEATPPNTQQPNQGNQNQQAPAQNDFRRMFGLGGAQGNPQQPHGGQQGQLGAPPNRPAGNLRVFNLGPIRIALGNVAVNAANNNNQGIAQAIQQQLAQNQQAQNPPNLPTFTVPGPPNTMIPASNSPDVQADILRLQENLINSIRQLHAQHDQLQYIQTLLGELNRIQQATGAAANGQQLPTITPLNPNWGPAGVQQAFLPTQGQSAMGPGDPGLPEGMILPAGYTLRRLAPVFPAADATNVTPPSQASQSQPPQPPINPSEHIRRALNLDATQTSSSGTQQQATSSHRPTPSAAPSTQPPAAVAPNPFVDAGSSTTAPAPPENHSSPPQSGWSFSQIAGPPANSASSPGPSVLGHSRTDAGSSAGAHGIPQPSAPTPRAATVDDGSDSE